MADSDRRLDLWVSDVNVQTNTGMTQDLLSIGVRDTTDSRVQPTGHWELRRHAVWHCSSAPHTPALDLGPAAVQILIFTKKKKNFVCSLAPVSVKVSFL